MLIVATEFPQQNLGIDEFLFTCIVVSTPQHGNENTTSLCQNFIPTSLSGDEIPTKWRGNEIPTNRLLELYTIYNPATWMGCCHGTRTQVPQVSTISNMWRWTRILRQMHKLWLHVGVESDPSHLTSFTRENAIHHQQLPKMSGAPLKFTMDPTAPPVTKHKHVPAAIPWNFREKVKAGLEPDCRMECLRRCLRTPQLNGYQG